AVGGKRLGSGDRFLGLDRESIRLHGSPDCRSVRRGDSTHPAASAFRIPLTDQTLSSAIRPSTRAQVRAISAESPARRSRFVFRTRVRGLTLATCAIHPTSRSWGT